MNKKITFLYGLSERKEFSHLSKYFNIPKIDWNKGKITPPINKPETIIGFSIGCMLAIMHTEKHKVKNLILCSPSPGEETLNKVKADNIIFIAGETEKWVLTDIHRLGTTHPNVRGVLVIPKGKHKLDKTYIKWITGVVEDLI